jgi:predicted small metal-binding protein
MVRILTETRGMRRRAMNQVNCECGFSVRDGDEDRVVEVVLQHVARTHPELAESVTPAVVRGWIELVP